MLARQRVNAVITLKSACQRRQRRTNNGSALLALDRHWHRGSHTVKALSLFLSLLRAANAASVASMSAQRY